MAARRLRQREALPLEAMRAISLGDVTRRCHRGASGTPIELVEEEDVKRGVLVVDNLNASRPQERPLQPAQKRVRAPHGPSTVR